MNDGMRMGDGMAAELACGHPNVQPQEVCPLCGKRVEVSVTEQAYYIQKDENGNEVVVKSLEMSIGTDISK